MGKKRRHACERCEQPVERLYRLGEVPPRLCLRCEAALSAEASGKPLALVLGTPVVAIADPLDPMTWPR